MDFKFDSAKDGLVVTQQLTVEECRICLIRAFEHVMAHEELLNSLDSSLGDGDHGTTMVRGAVSVIDVIGALQVATVNELFRATGTEMMRTMGGSSGALYGVFFRSANGVAPAVTLNLSWLHDFLQNGLDALQARTEARVGDKTLIDALVPGINALKSADVGAGPLVDGLTKVAEAAHAGAKSTIGVIPRFGRGRAVGERAAQAQDPGATSMWLLLEGFRQGVQNL